MGEGKQLRVDRRDFLCLLLPIAFVQFFLQMEQMEQRRVQRIEEVGVVRKAIVSASAHFKRDETEDFPVLLASGEAQEPPEVVDQEAGVIDREHAGRRIVQDSELRFEFSIQLQEREELVIVVNVESPIGESRSEVLRSLGRAVVRFCDRRKVIQGDDDYLLLLLGAGLDRGVSLAIEVETGGTALLVPLFEGFLFLLFFPFSVKSHQLLDEARLDIIQPSLFQRTDAAGVKAGGLDDLAGDDELGKGLEPRRARVDVNLIGRCAFVHCAAGSNADVLGQPFGDAGKVFPDRTPAGKRKTNLRTDFPKLLMDVDDLLHPLVIKIVFIAEILPLFLFSEVCILPEEIEVHHEIAVGGGVEGAMSRSAGILFAGRKQERRFRREEGDRDQDFVKDIRIGHHRFDHHSAVPGQERETDHQRADVGEHPVLVDRSDIPQRLFGALQSLVFRASDEGEFFIIINSQIAHPKHDFAQVGSKDLFSLVCRPALVIFFGEEAVACPRLGSARPPASLLAAGTAGGQRHQGRSEIFLVIEVELRHAKVDDDGDPVDRNARLGDVRGNDDLRLPFGCGSEDPFLLFFSQAPVQRIDFQFFPGIGGVQRVDRRDDFKLAA